MNLPHIQMMTMLVDKMADTVGELVLEEIMEEVVKMVGCQVFKRPYLVSLVRTIQSMLQSLIQNSHATEG